MIASSDRARVFRFAKVGKRARYSYLARDDRGNVVRKWHDSVNGLGEQAAKSLRGMTQP